MQASAFVGLLPMCDISIHIADAERRSRHTALKDGQPVTYLVFSGDDAVSGEVHFKFDPSSRRLDHVGIKVGSPQRTIASAFITFYSFLVIRLNLLGPSNWFTAASTSLYPLSASFSLRGR